MADFSAWEAYKQIEIDDTNVDANLTDFPALVAVVNDGNLGARCQADGDDIRFSLDDGTTELDFELLSFAIDGGLATGLWRVEIPSIAASGGATIRCYYGNDAVASGEDQTGTWNANFSAVYHMEDATTSTVGDSTSNGYTGTKTSANNPPEASGKIWKSQDFDGGYDSINTNQSTSAFISNSTGMVSCWVKPKGTAPTVSNAYAGDNVWGNIYNSRWLGVQRGIISGSDRLWAWNWDGSEDRIGVEYTADTWLHVVWLHTGGTLYAYKDGALVASTASGNTGNVTIGIWIGAAGSGGQQPFEGEIEEIQFLDAIPTNVAAWIKFQHANDSQADHEQTWGAEVVNASGNPWYYNLQQQVAA